MPSIKLETHCHTAETSPCGVLSARELVALYHEAGYQTLVVTDHLWSEWKAGLPMEKRVQAYLAGYRAAREAGSALGMHVLLGAELRMEPEPEDYLCYGLTEQALPDLMAFMDGHPSLSALHDYLRARGMLLLQAHPFRDGLRPMDLSLLDGVEVYNGNPRHDSRNGRALHHASARPGLILTSGSDAHQKEDVGRGGLWVSKPISDNAEWLSFLRECPSPRRIEDGK